MSAIMQPERQRHVWRLRTKTICFVADLPILGHESRFHALGPFI